MFKHFKCSNTPSINHLKLEADLRATASKLSKYCMYVLCNTYVLSKRLLSKRIHINVWSAKSSNFLLKNQWCIKVCTNFNDLLFREAFKCLILFYNITQIEIATIIY